MVYDEAHGVRPLELVVDGLAADVAVGFGCAYPPSVLVALGCVALSHQASMK